jgi:hypothetical protein
MDIDLVVARHRAVDFLALDIDGDDVVGPHFLDADAGRLHQEAPGISGKPHRNVSGDIIAVAFYRQHAPRVAEFFPQLIGHRIPPDAPCRQCGGHYTAAPMQNRRARPHTQKGANRERHNETFEFCRRW